jgi:hypothetical protein
VKVAESAFETASWDGGTWLSRVHVRTNGRDIGYLPVSSGTLTLDADAAANAQLRLSVPAQDGGWLPRGPGDDLFIVDTRCRVELGWIFPGGRDRTVSVASCWVTELDVNRPANTIDLVALSREHRLIEDPFLRGMSFGEGRTVRNAISDVMAGTIPNSVQIVERPGVDLSQNVGRTVKFSPGQSRWEAVEQLLMIANAVGYFDDEDRFVVMPPFSVANSPDVVMRTGARGNVASSRVHYQREGFGNQVRIIYTVEKKGERNVIGTWENTDPDVGANGRMGRIGLLDERKGKVTQRVADDAAARFGRRRNAVPRDVTVTAIPDPRIQLGDTVEVHYVSGGSTRFVVRRIDFGLGARNATMTLAGRGDVLAQTSRFGG